MTRPDHAIVFAVALSACGANQRSTTPVDRGGTGGDTNEGGTGGVAPQSIDAGAIADSTTKAPTPDAELTPDVPAISPDVATVITDPGSDGDGDFMIGPAFMPAPEYT